MINESRTIYSWRYKIMVEKKNNDLRFKDSNQAHSLVVTDLFDICDSMALWRMQETGQKNISLLSHNIHAFTITPLEALLFRYLNTKTLFVRYLTGDDMVLSRFCFLPPQQVLSVKWISSHNVSQNSTYVSLGIQITPPSSTADSILCTESVF